VIFAAFPIARLTFIPLMGWLSDKKGRKRFIATGLCLIIPVSWGYILAKNPAQLVGVRLCHGLAAAMVVPLVDAYVGDIVPDGQEGRYVGRLSIAMLAGFGMGPLVGGILRDRYGYAFTFYALGILSLVAFLLITFLLPKSSPKGHHSTLPTNLYMRMLRDKNILALFILRFANATSIGVLLSFLPILAHENMKLTSSQIGVLLSLSLVVASALQVPFGYVADRINRKAMVISGGVVFSCELFFFPSARSYDHILLASTLYGCGIALAFPSSAAMMITQGRSYLMGTVMGLFNFATSLGIATGPLFAGWIADALGITFLFRMLAGIGLSGVILFGCLHEPIKMLDN
jgi:MFS family permease